MTFASCDETRAVFRVLFVVSCFPRCNDVTYDGCTRLPASSHAQYANLTSPLYVRPRFLSISPSRSLSSVSTPPASHHRPSTLGNPIIRRLYRKHARYRRQSHWNVLNGTNVLTYVLFDRPCPHARTGICAAVVIQYYASIYIFKVPRLSKICKNELLRYFGPFRRTS